MFHRGWGILSKVMGGGKKVLMVLILSMMNDMISII